jgi:DNA-binding response OmpR family regulator
MVMGPLPPYVALLLVEHEAMVRAYLTRLSPAEASRDATPLLMAHEEPLQLVMGTVTMPFVNGRELAAVLESVQPRVPVLIVSGRKWYRALRKGRLVGSGPLVAVPFDPELVRARISALREDPAAA